MNNTLESSIFESLEQDGVISVFPTQTSLQFWKERYTRLSEKGVIRSDKLLPWDSFLRVLYPPTEKKEIHPITKHLFFHTFLQSESSEHLKWFVYPNEEGERTNFLFSLLELIRSYEDLRLLQHLDADSYNKIPKEYLSDVELIVGAYTSFLEKKELVDYDILPLSTTHLPQDSDIQYHIFFPEVGKLFHRFTLLKNLPSYIHVYYEDKEERASSILSYENELMESRSILVKIRSLLEQGVPSKEIVITAGDIKSIREYIELEARKEEIPLQVVESRPVETYAGGKFFSLLSDVVAQSFSFESVRRLLLDPRLGFKDRAMHLRLCKKGAELGITEGNLIESEDQWLTRLGLSNRQLFHWYNTFRSYLIRLVNSSTFKEMQTHLFTLISFLCEEDQWEGNQLDVFTYSLAQLGPLQEALSLVELDEVSSLYSLFVQLLQSVNYAPQHTKGGIHLYPYTTSVGISPLYHFVMGCTIEATSIEAKKLALLSEYQWGGTLTQEASDLFFSHYQSCGKSVEFSYASESFGSSSSLVHPYFMRSGEIEKVDYVPRSLFDQEKEAWRTPSYSFTPTPAIANTFKKGKRTAFSPPRIDTASLKTRMAYNHIITDERGLARLSSTQMDAFFACPFKWASQYVYKLRKQTYDYLLEDHAAIGSAQHSLLERFFSHLSGPFHQEKSSEYLEVFHQLLHQVLKEYESSVSAPLPFAMNYIKKRHFSNLEAIITAEGETFDGYTSIAFEAKEEREYPDNGYILIGRIDRMSEDSEHHTAVIDYKKNYTVAKSAYKKSDTLPSHQLILYAKLLRDSESKEVTDAAFYNIEKGEYVSLWNQDSLEERDRLIEIFEQDAVMMVSSFHQGALGATPSDSACQYCDYRPLCRRRYSLI